MVFSFVLFMFVFRIRVALASENENETFPSLSVLWKVYTRWAFFSHRKAWWNSPQILPGSGTC